MRFDNASIVVYYLSLIHICTLSDDEIKDLLTEGHTQLLKGFKSKQDKSFDAVVAFDEEYNTTLVFPEKKSKASSPKKRK